MLNRVRKLLDDPSFADQFARLSDDELARRFSFLERLANHDKVVVSLFNRPEYRYIYHSANFNRFYGLAEDSPFMQPGFIGQLVEDTDVYHRFMEAQLQIYNQFPVSARGQLTIIGCGVAICDFSGTAKRLFMKSVPVSETPDEPSRLSLNIMEDVGHLLEGAGFWTRVCYEDTVYSFWSGQLDAVPRELLTNSELAVLKLWAKGHSLQQIADQRASSLNTIKNQLKAARQRMLARDNSALLQLCIKSDILA